MFPVFCTSVEFVLVELIEVIDASLGAVTTTTIGLTGPWGSDVASIFSTPSATDSETDLARSAFPTVSYEYPSPVWMPTSNLVNDRTSE